MSTHGGAGDKSAWSRNIEANLKTQILGKPMVIYETVTSTNDAVKDFAGGGAPEGLTVVARAQSQGRGRRGRTWESPEGQGAYLSVLLRPELPNADAGWLAILGGVAAADALEELGLKGLSLKWPNDVLVGGRKIGGVLVEPRVGAAAIDFAVVGIGINVEQGPDSWTGSLKGTATSCRMEGLSVGCEDVIARVLEHTDRWYLRLKAGESQQLMQAWVRRGGTSAIPTLD
ncbi:MAG: biotin--[acetyl-CoA-carboxylase] ligase [Verrucomicrobiota bacterium]